MKDELETAWNERYDELRRHKNTLERAIRAERRVRELEIELARQIELRIEEEPHAIARAEQRIAELEAELARRP